MMVLQPFANIFIATCVLLMFSSKQKPWFDWFCGCLEKRLIAKWIKLEIASSKQRSDSADLKDGAMSVDVDHKSNIEIEMVPMDATPTHNNSINVELSPIKENERILTLPDDPKFVSSPLHIFQEHKSSEKAETLSDSITQSEVLVAMMELELTGTSITVMTE